MKELYINKRLSARTVKLIEKANEIIAEYQEAGYTLTLRQLYYQFVSRMIIPNAQNEYKNLGEAINKGRLAGMIDWYAIEDRTRNLRDLQTWSSPKDILQDSAAGYRTDYWKNQPNYCEVWIEKDALIGVVEPACNALRVPYFACRGYTSQSEQHSAGRRITGQIQAGKNVVIFHFGDHDPSGIDMTRDNLDRLNLFVGVNQGIITPSEEYNGNLTLDNFRIERLALNMNQIRKHKPPPNPAKLTDSRFESYAKKYGKQSWELDALDPKLIGEMITSHVEKLIDKKEWKKSKAAEDKDIKKLQRIAKKG